MARAGFSASGQAIPELAPFYAEAFNQGTWSAGRRGEALPRTTNGRCRDDAV